LWLGGYQHEIDYYRNNCLRSHHALRPGVAAAVRSLYIRRAARESWRSRAGQHVPSMRDESVSNPQGADVKAVQPTGEEVDLNTVHPQ